jgi:hypothetical protein
LAGGRKDEVRWAGQSAFETRDMNTKIYWGNIKGKKTILDGEA